MVRPKKHLGQHFLTDQIHAQHIVEALHCESGDNILEIGPGTGVLTRYLNEIPEINYYLSEIDSESVEYLHEHYPKLGDHLFEEDFLKMDLRRFEKNGLKIIGNFPYNISSQILFRAYHEKHMVKEVVGMFQKEVAKRVASPPGSKDYGILSVLIQAFYDIEYLFTVPPGAFFPPPKVDSGVIRLIRNETIELNCSDKDFTRVVKMAFNQRRKTLRNALKALCVERGISEFSYMDKRAEQLHFKEFEEITCELSQ